MKAMQLQKQKLQQLQAAKIGTPVPKLKLSNTPTPVPPVCAAPPPSVPVSAAPSTTAAAASTAAAMTDEVPALPLDEVLADCVCVVDVCIDAIRCDDAIRSRAMEMGAAVKKTFSNSVSHVIWQSIYSLPRSTLFFR